MSLVPPVPGPSSAADVLHHEVGVQDRPLAVGGVGRVGGVRRGRGKRAGHGGRGGAAVVRVGGVAPLKKGERGVQGLSFKLHSAMNVAQCILLRCLY